MYKDSYNDSYNDYIRNVLGKENTNGDNNNDNSLKYPEEDKSYYCDYSHPKNNMQNYDLMYSDYQNRYGMPDYYEYGYYPNGYNSYDTRENSEIEECYPEIYSVVYPMVQKACRNITEPVTKEDVEKMVEELYGSLEGNDDINVNITLNNNIDNLNSIQVEQNQEKKDVRQPNRSTGLFKPNVEPKREVSLKPKLEEPKQPRFCNNGLCDIIRILLVRELIGGPNRPPIRPPYPPFRPGPGPRPPFGPGPRPPFYR